MRNVKFIGRDQEIQSLEELLDKKTASLAVIKGRRRIGKTRLIEEFAKNKQFLRFMGLAPVDGVTAQDQRDEFSRLLSTQTGLPELNVDNWAKLFNLLADKIKTGRHIVLFDEISWMAHDDPTFLSKLKNAWELVYQKNPELILILCGSVSSWIEKNILSSTGYFGRISKKITLKELPINDCNKLLKAIGFKRSAHEKFQLLSVTGGIPWYIELINPTYSAAQNIQALCFNANGILVDEHKYIFHDLFGKRSKIYEKITAYLAKGAVEYANIANGINYTSSGLLSEYLDDLIEAGYITRSFAWDFRLKKERKISLYRLSDNYLRFYYKYINPKLNIIKNNQYKDINITSLPNWNGIMGFQFESLVLNNRDLIQKSLNLSPIDVVANDIYYQRKTKNIKGCQIDYLIQTRVNTLFICEIKFSQNPLSTNVIQEVKEKIKNLVVPKNFVCLPVLIHVNDVTKELENSEYFFQLINFSEFL